jgi:hypothetical protein
VRGAQGESDADCSRDHPGRELLLVEQARQGIGRLSATLQERKKRIHYH